MTVGAVGHVGQVSSEGNIRADQEWAERRLNDIYKVKLI